MNRVLFFTDKISLSGASKIINWVANCLAEKNYDVSLITYLPVKDQREFSVHVNRVSLNIEGNNRINRGVRIINELRKIIKKEKFDVCIGFLPTECLYLQIAVRGLNTKVIVCERSDPFFEKSFIANLGRYFFRFADGAVFQTNGAKKYFPKSLQSKSIVIPNPSFSVEGRIVPYTDREYVITTSGRLFIRQKRQDILLLAFKKLSELDNKIKLKIYGDGPDKEKLVNLCNELGISHVVSFEGNVKNVEALIANSKVFVLTSDYEGIPNVIVEAMQQGVPVVTTDCSPGGARELIEDGV